MIGLIINRCDTQSVHHEFFRKQDSKIEEMALFSAPAVHPGIDIDPNGREQLKNLNLKAKAYQFETRKTLIMSGKYYYEFKLDFVTKKQAKDPNKVNFIRSKFQDVFK